MPSTSTAGDLGSSDSVEENLTDGTRIVETSSTSPISTTDINPSQSPNGKLSDFISVR